MSSASRLRCPWESAVVENAPRWISTLSSSSSSIRYAARARRDRFLQAEQPIEQVEVGEDHREVLGSPLTVCLSAIALAVQSDHPRLGRVEAREHLHEGRLAAAVAADEEDDLAAAQGEVDRAEREGPAVDVRRICERHPVELEPVPPGLERQAPPAPARWRGCASERPSARTFSSEIRARAMIGQSSITPQIGVIMYRAVRR